MKHTNNIKSCEISKKQLAEEIGDLFYDSLSELLRELSQKLNQDSNDDKDRGRTMLAKNLNNASELILEASKEIDCAWYICKEPTEKWLRENNQERS